MTRPILLAGWALMTLAFGTAPEARGEDGPKTTYQLRSYTTAPEKLDVLVERFARVNLPLFERHDITLIGAWVPHESDEGPDRFVYLVAFPSKQAGETCWDAFANDPEWVNAFERERNEHGQVVSEVETAYLRPTDYTPELPPIADRRGPDREPVGLQGEDRHLFELRRYVASPGKLDDLNARFRNHTMELFDKHGMTNLLYTEPVEGEEGAGEVLLYFLAHPSYAEALNSWEGFRTDPAWNRVREESQADGVPLAAEVETWMLVPTEFSPLQ